MLDTETKARIDSARDILVGKVPEDLYAAVAELLIIVYRMRGTESH